MNASTDMYEKLSVMTDTYLQKEREVNPLIKDYKDSGYLDVRKQVYDILIDIAHTFKNFDTSSPEEKNDKIQRFIELNNELEKQGVSKILP